MSESSSGSGSGCISFVTYMVGLVIAVVCSFRGCVVNGDKATRAMETAGYTEVHLLDRGDIFVGLRGCEATDAVVFHMQAKNPAGKTVNTMVCSGWPFKGSTIRSY